MGADNIFFVQPKHENSIKKIKTDHVVLFFFLSSSSQRKMPTKPKHTSFESGRSSKELRITPVSINNLSIFPVELTEVVSTYKVDGTFDQAIGYLKFNSGYHTPYKYIVGIEFRNGRMNWLWSSHPKRKVAIIPTASSDTYKLIFFWPSTPVKYVDHQAGDIINIRSDRENYLTAQDVDIHTVVIEHGYYSLQDQTTSIINITTNERIVTSIPMAQNTPESQVPAEEAEPQPHIVPRSATDISSTANKIPMLPIILGSVGGGILVILGIVFTVRRNRRRRD
jgi:hypothetical protein